MFQIEMEEKRGNIVEIKDLSAAAVQGMLSFIYMNKVLIEIDTVDDLLKASDKYEIIDLKNLCGKYLMNILDIKNCIKIVSIAELFNMQELKISAINFIVSISHHVFEMQEIDDLATVIVTYVLSELDQLENELLKSDAMIYKYDRFVHQNIVFKHTKGGSKPFYKWKYNEHKNNIEKLLHGHRVTLKADIKQGFKGNAVKFNKIGINFASSNKTIKQKLVKLLSGFSVTLIHLGHSFYRCDDRIYMIPSDNQAIIYSMTHHPESNVPVTTNKVYDKIAKNEPVLSLYATWQIQLNGDKDRFDELSKYANETIDLVLEGKGQYVDLNLPVVCNKQLDQYYSRSNNQMNTIQIYEKLPESDLTKVEKWIDELLLGIVSTV
uniref:BTB domain-containing protein n=1 Tax=Trichogramma kaykai TaxID=54128 RepID=A0ABD2XIM4_9HYME